MLSFCRKCLRRVYHVRLQIGRNDEHAHFKWMKQIADQTGALIMGSYIVKVHDRFYNRLLWMEPGGNFKTYDKRHLFEWPMRINAFLQEKVF